MRLPTFLSKTSNPLRLVLLILCSHFRSTSSRSLFQIIPTAAHFPSFFHFSIFLLHLQAYILSFLSVKKNKLTHLLSKILNQKMSSETEKNTERERDAHTHTHNRVGCASRSWRVPHTYHVKMGTKTGAFEEEEEEEEEKKKRRKRKGSKINRHLPSKERMESMHEPARNGKHNKRWQTNAKGQKKRELRSASNLTN